MQRTSHADGAARVATPEVAWTTQLGGVLDIGQAGVGDIDGDGRPDVVTVSAGRAKATGPTGNVLWQSALAGVDAVLGIWNLDAAGSSEVVVHEPTGLAILDGGDGHQVAAIPLHLSVTVEFIPLSTGGGLLAVANAGGQLAAYDMRGGLQIGTPLWTTSVENEIDIVVGDVDGDGQPDIVRPLNSGFQVLDVLTGAVKFEANPIGPAANVYVYELVQADASPGLEILAVDTSYVYSPSAGIYVLGVRGGALTTLWSSTQTPQLALGADYYTVSGAVADLDGDGSPEAVYSEWDGAAQQWTTYVVDAASGASLASLPGQIIQALADVDGDGRVDIAVRSNPLADKTPPRSTLTVFDFTRAAGATAKPWTVPNAHVVTTSAALRTRQGLPDHPISASFGGAVGSELLVGQDDAHRRADTILGTLRANGSLAAKLAIAQGVDTSVLWVGDRLTASNSHDDVLSFGDDGVAHALTASLQEQTTFHAGSYANWIGVYGLDANRTVVSAATSNRELQWLDGTHLHVDGTPYELLGLPGVVDSSSSAAQGLPLDPMTYLAGPSPTFVATQQGETAQTLVGLDTSGVESFTIPLAPGAHVLSPGAYAQDMNGDGTADLVVPVLNINSLESIAIFSGSTGTVLRSTPLATIVPKADTTTTGALADVNGDGVKDLIAPLHDVGDIAVDLSVDPMALIWSVPFDQNAQRINGTIAAAAVDPAGPSLLRFNGNNGLGQYARYSRAGAVVVSRDEGTLPAQGADTNAAALVVRSPGTSVYDLVSAGMAGDALSRLRRIAGDTLDTVWTEYLANGAVTSTPPAQAYQLHDPVAVDVDGDGADEVVLGSGDGRLYAVRASDGSLVFALDLGAPVDHVIAADVDLDPEVEIVAFLGDGRLVAIDGSGQYRARRDTADGGIELGCGDAGDDYVPVHGACACDAAGAGDRPAAATGLAAVLAIAGVARRRRGTRPV
jgi:hypothetical protein